MDWAGNGHGAPVIRGPWAAIANSKGYKEKTILIGVSIIFLPVTFLLTEAKINQSLMFGCHWLRLQISKSSSTPAHCTSSLPWPLLVSLDLFLLPLFMGKECIIMRKHMSSDVWRTRSSRNSSVIPKLWPKFHSFLVYVVFVFPLRLNIPLLSQTCSNAISGFHPNSFSAP